jgi:flavin reductase (DIM6/NTAB) family NADH-FMN oxidoreductase RutF
MIDRATFKDVMATAPGPVAVVTATGADGKPRGLTMSAVCSVSLEPPLALACLDLRSNTLRAVRESDSFTINYLAHGCDDLARHFATKVEEKFDRCRWTAPPDGVGGPILNHDAAAYVVCRVRELVEAGDHVVVIGDVVGGSARDEAHAMAFARRQFFTGMQVQAELDRQAGVA